MKIAFLAFPLTRGKETGRGLERVIDELCDYWNKKGVDYKFYDRGLIRNEVKAALASLRYLGTVKKMKADSYLAIYPVAGVFPALLKKHSLVTAVHDLVPFNVFGFDNWLKYAVKRWCIRYACKRSDHLITSYPSTKYQLVKLFGIDPEKITVIPYAVNHQNYYVEEKTEKNRYQVSFLGEAKRAKGMDSAILAFKEVQREIPAARLVLASRGSELMEMQKLAKDSLLRGSYTFVGFIPEDKMRKFYNQTDVFLFPSRYGFGLSSLEAAACGTPAVVGATLDAKDFWKDEDLLVDPDKPADLARKVVRLLTDRKLYEAKRAELIKIVKSYSWKTFSDQYLEVLKKSS